MVDTSRTFRKPALRLSFFYLHCNDVVAMRGFYVDLLGMKIVSFVDSAQVGWLALDGGGVQLMFFRAPAPLPVRETWAVQPGWDGGTECSFSWSLSVPELDFAGTVERLRAASVPQFHPRPIWCQDSYWGFPVRDPMGNTVEVFLTPYARPEDTTWPGK